MKIGLTETEWQDDPESIAAWVAAVEHIEPFTWANGEEQQHDEYMARYRQCNIDAVREQMERLPDGDAP